jgi:hypothetical protein
MYVAQAAKGEREQLVGVDFHAAVGGGSGLVRELRAEALNLVRIFIVE